MVLSSVIKCSPIIKMKKESPKNQKTKIYIFFQNSKGHKKDIEKGRKNPEKYKKSLATTLIFFTLFFVYK